MNPEEPCGTKYATRKITVALTVPSENYMQKSRFVF